MHANFLKDGDNEAVHYLENQLSIIAQKPVRACVRACMRTACCISATFLLCQRALLNFNRLPDSTQLLYRGYTVCGTRAQCCDCPFYSEEQSGAWKGI